MWTLIIFFLAANQHDGKAVATAEYVSKEACNKAQTAIHNAVKEDVVTVCTYQGED
jgi:hypothetical protein